MRSHLRWRLVEYQPEKSDFRYRLNELVELYRLYDVGVHAQFIRLDDISFLFLRTLDH